jgi:hypothetical protein
MVAPDHQVVVPGGQALPTTTGTSLIKQSSTYCRHCPHDLKHKSTSLLYSIPTCRLKNAIYAVTSVFCRSNLLEKKLLEQSNVLSECEFLLYKISFFFLLTTARIEDLHDSSLTRPFLGFEKCQQDALGPATIYNDHLKSKCI